MHFADVELGEIVGPLVVRLGEAAKLSATIEP